MATDVRTLPYQQTDDTAFRAWVAGVDAALQAVGLVRTADTGQLDPTTVLKPTVAGNIAGYRVYRFNDALQATTPIFIKVGYGITASAGLQTPRIQITVGTGSDGAGNINGIIFGPLNLDASTLPSAGEQRNTYTSGKMTVNARVGIYIGVDTTNGSSANGRIIGFSIERQKDATGADVADAFHVSWWTNTSAGHQSFSVTASAPAAEGNLPALAPSRSMAAGADVGVSPVFGVFGKLLPPLLGLMGYWSADLQVLTPVSITVYGTAHTYLPMGANSWGAWLRGGAASTTSQALAILWE